MEEIKNESLIESINKIDAGTTIIIKNGHKLSEVFNFLPPGIICKSETGMGATYLELTSQRPSIIVEPLKITASAKAKHHEACYYGSQTKIQKGEKPNFFLQKLNSLPVEKRKIVVVADSLPIIKKLLKDEFEQYFLMIDEADSFQIDSSFRDSMSICFDIYLEHPKKNRALITATPLKFTNPKLQTEYVTEIYYKDSVSRNIKLINCQNVTGSAIDEILKIVTDFPMDKILIAYNSVSGCMNIINHLVNNANISNNSVSLLCGFGNKKNAGNYYQELSNDRLPTKINFATSAYFTGFDLNEQYHLICISNGRQPMFQLSEHRIKQIVGRSRKGVYSETIIYSLSNSTIEIPSFQTLEAAANQEIKALNCFQSHYSINKHLQSSLATIRNYIVQYTGENNTQYVRYDQKGEPTINYLSIDSFFERCRVQNELYQDTHQLNLQLKSAGHNVHHREKESDTFVEEVSASNSQRKIIIPEMIDRITNMTENEFANYSMEHGHNELENLMIDVYFEFIGYLEKQDIVNIIRCLESSDNRKFNNMRLSAVYAILDDNDHFKRAVTHNIKIGTRHTKEELLKLWSVIIMETGVRISLKSAIDAVKITKLYFLVKKDKRAKEHKIEGINPNSFNVIMKKDTSSFKFNINDLYKDSKWDT